MILLFVTGAAAILTALVINVFAAQLTAPIILIPEFLKLSLSKNPGIAFSISIPSPWQEILIVCALIAVTILAMKTKKDRWSSIAFGLIIGGAVANLIDRFMDGFVTDYIAVGTFPIFNVADSCITIGAALLLLHAFVQGRKST